MNNDLFSEEKEFIFKNEILDKKVRSKSGTKPKINLNKKLSENKKNLFKNKNVKMIKNWRKEIILIEIRKSKIIILILFKIIKKIRKSQRLLVMYL